MKIENIQSTDYDLIISNLNEWWGGRNMTDMLPRLFFKHFNNTSFIVKEDNDSIIGFIVGFVSQTEKTKAYVHFIGVKPDKRGKNVGKKLYERFFLTVDSLGVNNVECVTSIKNVNSIEFHKRIGFTIIEGDSIDTNGISYHKNYDGQNEDRVLFCYKT